MRPHEATGHRRELKGLLLGSTLLFGGFAGPAIAATQAGRAASAPAAPAPTLAAPAQATGATEVANGVGDIIVTARQRSETLISVPATVSAVSKAALANYGTTDIRDIVKLVPSLNIDRSGSGSGGLVSLRGISTNSSEAGFDPAVAINVDGVQVGRPRILTQGLFDIDQIEVLEGPQALFFGKNSPGGVMSIKTSGPSNHFEAFARAAYEFVGNEPIIEGAVSGPLSSSFGARLAIRYRNLDGWVRNDAPAISSAQTPFDNGTVLFGVLPAFDPGPPVAIDRRPGQKEMIGRLTLAYQPAGANLDVTLKLSASNYRSTAFNNDYYNCGAFTKGITYGVPDPYSSCGFDEHFSSGGLPNGVVDKWPYARQYNYQTSRQYLGSLGINYRFSDLVLSAVTGYYKSTTSTGSNYDGTVYTQIYAAEHEKYSAFSQELRLLSKFDAPVNFLLGAYYQDTKLNFFNASKLLALGPDPFPGPNQGKYQSFERPATTFGKTYSAFGQISWAVTPKVELSGGVRYTSERKDSSITDSYLHPGLETSFTGPSQKFVNKLRDSNYSPEVTLTWRPSSNATAYVSYKTGYKSGGFSNSAVLGISTTAAALAFGPERINGVEGGIKARLLDKKLTLTSAIYNYRYNGLQITAFDASTLSFSINNADARVSGASLNANYHPLGILTLTGALAYNNARYTRFVANCWGGQTAATGCNVAVPGPDGVLGTADDGRKQDLKGQQLPRAPRFVANAGFALDVPTVGGWHFGIDGNARYTSNYFAIDNSNPFGIVPHFALFDGSVRAYTPSHKLEIALIGRNLTNRYYASLVTEKPGAPTTPGITTQLFGAPNRGRQVLLEVTVRY